MARTMPLLWQALLLFQEAIGAMRAGDDARVDLLMQAAAQALHQHQHGQRELH
jgi:hypothetical protein